MRPIDRRDAFDALRAWGQLVREFGDNTPEGYGWMGSTVEWRAAMGRGGQSEFTLPEAACYMLERRGSSERLFYLVGNLVNSMPFIQRMCMTLKYVEDLENRSIELQTGATTRELRRHIESGEELVYRAMVKQREAA